MILSQQDYWLLLQDSLAPKNGINPFDTTWNYPQSLGQGYWREIQLGRGLLLMISHYQLHTPVTVQLPERSHPVEYSLYLSGGFKNQSSQVSAGQYALWGSGTAPVEKIEPSATEDILEINVHIEPELLINHWQTVSETPSPELEALIQPISEIYDMHCGQITLEMQTAVQQILHCPFQGITQKLYLESKVWELMALILAKASEHHPRSSHSFSSNLKPDDIDRIHQARDILRQRLDNPPSLIDLARQVGLNDCTLKRGFRQVFRTTAFGYLHDYRLEQARKLLEARQLNISQIAQAIGFANRSYFASAFRKKFGVTPREYLTRYRNSV